MVWCQEFRHVRFRAGRRGRSGASNSAAGREEDELAADECEARDRLRGPDLHPADGVDDPRGGGRRPRLRREQLELLAETLETPGPPRQERDPWDVAGRAAYRVRDEDLVPPGLVGDARGDVDVAADVVAV